MHRSCHLHLIHPPTERGKKHRCVFQTSWWEGEEMNFRGSCRLLSSQWNYVWVQSKASTLLDEGQSAQPWAGINKNNINFHSRIKKIKCLLFHSTSRQLGSLWTRCTLHRCRVLCSVPSFSPFLNPLHITKHKSSSQTGCSANALLTHLRRGRESRFLLAATGRKDKWQKVLISHWKRLLSAEINTSKTESARP